MVRSLNVSAEFASLAAEIGVLLLLFTLGLEYTPKELTTALAKGATGGVADLVLNFVPGLAAGLLLGWEPVAAVLLGGVTYISSSGVIAKLVGDLGRIGNRETPHILTVLVFEDLVMAVYLPVVSVLLIGSSMLQGVRDVGIALAVVLAILWALSRWGQPMSDMLERRSDSVGDEVVLLSVFGSVLLIGGLVQQVEVSAAVGAFLVGVAISGPAQHRAAAVIDPLRHLFAAIFFLRLRIGHRPRVSATGPASGVGARSGRRRHEARDGLDRRGPRRDRGQRPLAHRHSARRQGGVLDRDREPRGCRGRHGGPSAGGCCLRADPRDTRDPLPRRRDRAPALLAKRSAGPGPG
ncbi:MAG: cation:proton antiporter [Microthrixaceae bacterium]